MDVAAGGLLACAKSQKVIACHALKALMVQPLCFKPYPYVMALRLSLPWPRQIYLFADRSRFIPYPKWPTFAQIMCRRSRRLFFWALLSRSFGSMVICIGALIAGRFGLPLACCYL